MANNDRGDFQTPAVLIEQVLDVLPKRRWARVLEPTCGKGGFLSAAARFGSAERVGIEINAEHAEAARLTGARILTGSIFDFDLGTSLGWHRTGPLLVVGNPPWVTRDRLTQALLGQPARKDKPAALRGMDAMTGESNFDIAESILIKLFTELAGEQPTVAVLCKTHVARRVLDYCDRFGVPLTGTEIRRIDAKRWFDASVDACLFVTTVGGHPDRTTPVYSGLSASEPESRLGFADGGLVSDIEAYGRSSDIDGGSQIEWRQGVKHDAAAVMELTSDGHCFTNRSGEPVEVEPEWVYPLMKGADVHHGRRCGRSVIITQRSLDEGTTMLRVAAPRLWAYLTGHADVLDARKSSIYRGRPRFAMFGVGEYTFAPWKVAISGLHSSARFRLVAPLEDRPVLFDDTCYMLPFADGPSAAITAALLRSPLATDLLRSLMFADSKRPITKKLLQRIDLRNLAVTVPAERAASEASALLGQEIPVRGVEAFEAGL